MILCGHKVGGVQTTIKALAKDLAKGTDKEGPTVSTVAFRGAIKPALRKALEKLPTSMLSDPLVPSEYKKLKTDVFSMQAWGMVGKHCNIGLLPFGLAECRILMEGDWLPPIWEINEIDRYISTKQLN